MLLHTGFAFPSKNRPAARLPARFQINIGPCTWIIDRKCPDNDISFYLYTRNNRKDRQHLYVDDSLETSNLSDTFFDPSHPVKIIVHGYNSDMFLTPLIQMKEGLCHFFSILSIFIAINSEFRFQNTWTVVIII